MLILIAESKSMNTPLPVSQIAGSVPAFAAQADEIMHSLHGLSVSQLSDKLKLGPKNAQRLFDDIFNFPDKSVGINAINAYTGVVFKSFDYKSLSPQGLKNMDSDLRIVSSLYGILNPQDIIKPYRLDFGMKAAPDGKALSAFWKQKLTISLVKHLQDTGDTEVLNLLPLDASKCFDWKLIKNFAQVYIAGFKQYTDGGELRTPTSDHLKRLRGKLLRHILEAGAKTGSDLRGINLPDLAYECDEPYQNHLLFTTA